MLGIHTVLTYHVEVHILPQWPFPSTNNIFYQWLMPWDEESPRYKTLVKCWEVTIVPARVNLSQQLQLWTSHCFLPGNVRLRGARPLRVRARPLQDRPFWVGLLILLPNSGLAACHSEANNRQTGAGEEKCLFKSQKLEKMADSRCEDHLNNWTQAVVF